MTETTAENAPRRPIGLGRVQRRRKRALLIAGILLTLALPFLHSLGADSGFLHEGLETFGLILIFAAIMGRSWCALYIGGRKSGEIVSTGPYSVCRNPLYLFSIVAVGGIGLQSGSLTLAFAATLIAFAIFRRVIGREEAELTKRFGASYRRYVAAVPRLWPRLSAWREAETLVVHPEHIWRTFFEALLFLLAIPVCELVDKLQDAGYFLTFFHLP